NTMAEQNVPAQPPTRTDEQIVPRSQWLTIGKSNLLFNAQKIQKNPIFLISVDILSNTNFFQAFTASANVPAIYLQQFWKTMSYNEKTGVYSCQVDEQWFDLSADLLRKALAITPVNPSTIDIRTNYVYQPWRAILSLLNQCLTGKTSGSDKPRHPVLQMLWGIVTQTNVDHAELIWEEFTQGIQTFFSHKASLKKTQKNVNYLLIPYGRFSKVIIYYLASNNNIHRRPDSAVHHTGDDYVLGNLKFVPKGESVEVFGMAIPDPLITEAIQQSSYYPKYLQMVAENTKKTPQESASVQPATKRATPKKPTTTTPVKQSKPAPPPSKKPSKRKLPQKIRKGKPTFQLVDEEDEARQDDDPDLDLAKKLSLESHQEKGEEEGNDADLERAIKLSLDPVFLPQGRAPVGGVTIRDPVSDTTSKLHEVVGKGKAVVSEEQVAHSLIDMSKKKETMISLSPDDTSEKVIHEFRQHRVRTLQKVKQDNVTPKGDKESRVKVDSVYSKIGVRIPVQNPENAREALGGPDPRAMKDDQTGADLEIYMCLLSGPTLSTWLKNSSSRLPKGTKLDDALLKVLERHTADLIEKYSVLPGPEFVKNQESEKNAYGKEVADKVKANKRSRIVMMMMTMLMMKASAGQTRVGNIWKRSDSVASGSAKPPPKADDQSSKKPRESEASASKQHPTLTSTGWQITDTRDDGADSSMHKSDPDLGHSEQSLNDISMQDEGNDLDMGDTDNAHIPKVSTTTWFKPIPESERPATPEPEWTIPPNDFSEPEHDWANAYATTTLDYLLTGDKSENCLIISKLKAARYLDFGLEELVPTLWVKSELEYDINVVYGITHCKMRILSVDQCQGLRKVRIQLLETRDEVIQTKDQPERQIGMRPTITLMQITRLFLRPRALSTETKMIKEKLMRLNELHKFSDGTLT
ncbi:hypothetical protein Tco_0671136, partial [Tanacetum coccineum]